MADDLTILGLWQGGDDIIAYALVWSLCVIMLHIFIDDVPQVRFTEDQHLIETLGFYAPDEAFDVGGHVWAGNRCLLTDDTAGL